MQCPTCNYLMSDFDKECPRCARNGTSNPSATAAQSTTSPPSQTTRHPFPQSGTAYVTRDGNRYGPYSLQDINKYLQAGNILQSDQLLTDSQAWVPLTQIDGVIASAPNLAPPSSKRTFTPPIPGDTTSSNNSFNQPLSSEFPAELKGFNFGAFFWSWIWGIAHNVYWPLVVLILGLIPFGQIIAIGIGIYLGINGNELAWNNRKWESAEQFKETQNAWSRAGWIGLAAIPITILLIFLVLRLT